MPTFTDLASVGTGGSLRAGAALRGAADPVDVVERMVATLGAGTDGLSVLLRVLLLAAGAVVAGSGLVSLLPPGWGGEQVLTNRRRWIVAGASAVTVATTVWLAVAADVPMLATLVQIVLAVAVPVVLWARAARSSPEHADRWVAVAAVPLAGLLAWQFASGRSGVAFVLDVGYWIAIAVLLGLILVRRNGSAAPWVAAVAVLAAIGQLLLTGPASAADLFGTAYGLAALAAVALPVLGALAWLVATRPTRTGAPLQSRTRARDLRRFAAVGTIGGLAAATVLGTLAPPAPAAVPGQPLLRAVDLDGSRVALLVAPMRPGRNLVHLAGGTYPVAPGTTSPAPAEHQHGAPRALAPSVTVDGATRPVLAAPGARGGWAVVDLPAGTSTLTISSGLGQATVPVDTGDAAPAAATYAGPDGPECSSTILGSLLGSAAGEEAGIRADGTTPTCPSEALDPADADAVRAMVGRLKAGGVTTARLVADASPRSVAASRVVGVAAAASGITLTDRPDEHGVDRTGALIVVSGWATARGLLDDATARSATAPTYPGGTFLAPWLLTSGVITAAPSTFVPLTFGPQEPEPQRYAALLAATVPGDAPSESGYVAWARNTRQPLDDRPTLFGAAPVDVPMTDGAPGDTSHHGGGNPAAWFPGGAVVPVGTPLDPS